MTPPPSTHETTSADAPGLGVASAGWCESWVFRLAEVLTAVVLAGVVFAQFDNPNQHIDELYHVLAAKSLNTDGDLMIGETGEPYTRARGFTHTVALSFRLFGEGVWQARLPSMLAGLALVGLLFPWVRWRFGRLSSWLWLVLMLQSPLVIFATEFCRFYMVQALMVAAMLVCGDLLLDRARAMAWRCAASGLGFVALVVAVHMQISSAFAVATVGGGVLLCGLWRWGGTRDHPAGWRVGLIGGLAALGLALFWVGIQWVEPVQENWARYLGSAAWAEATRLDTGYYLAYLRQWHRWWYYLWPAAALLAFYQWRWRAAWVAAVFLVGLGAHSYGGMKAPRYLLWAFPYFWLLLALGASALAALVSPRANPEEPTGRRWLRVTTCGAVVVVGMLVTARTTGPYQVRQMLTGGDHAFQYADWHGLRPALERDSAWAGGVLLASVDTKAIDAYARCDYSLSMSRTQDRAEFEPDWRTGRPVISTGESVRRVIREHPAGLIVIEVEHWRQDWAVPEDAADVIEMETEQVDVDPAMGLLVYRWDQRPGDRSEGTTP